MKNMIVKILILICIFPSKVIASGGFQKTFRSIDDILYGFNGEIIEYADLDEEVQEYILDNTINRKVGNIIDDFNGDGEKDISILIKQGDNDALFLLFFLCEKDCQLKNSFDLGEFYGLQFIELVEAGIKLDRNAGFLIDKSKIIQLKNASVRYYVYGKISAIYYFDDTIRKFLTIERED